MWFYVPVVDEKAEGWTGSIEPPSGPGEFWSIEAVRHVGLEDLHNAAPFENRLVNALLNHQEPCTLVDPRIQTIDPGSLGVRLTALRTRVKGEATALLRNLVVEDREAAMFLGYSVDSPTFSLWYGAPAFRSDLDYEARTYAVTIEDTKRESYPLADGTRIVVTTGVEVRENGYNAALHSTSALRVDFAQAVSLDRLMSTTIGLERLFGFLIGFRGTFPKFRTWTGDTYRVGDSDITTDGDLEVSGLDWKSGDLPHPLSCRHRRGWGGASIELVLERFLLRSTDLLTRIAAVERSELFTTDIFERFASTMPILEAYLKARYTTPDEASFLQAQKAFFDWVDQSPDSDVIGFSRKHLDVKKSKAPSLRMLLDRAIAFVNSKGFAFPTDYAARIQARRGSVFHRAPQEDQSEIRKFWADGLAVTNLLLLHTLDDLGIDIAYLAENYPSGSLRWFVQRTERSPLD